MSYICDRAVLDQAVRPPGPAAQCHSPGPFSRSLVFELQGDVIPPPAKVTGWCVLHEGRPGLAHVHVRLHVQRGHRRLRTSVSTSCRVPGRPGQVLPGTFRNFWDDTSWGSTEVQLKFSQCFVDSTLRVDGCCAFPPEHILTTPAGRAVAFLSPAAKFRAARSPLYLFPGLFMPLMSVIVLL